MSILDFLSDERVWNAFYEYKMSLACPKQFAAELGAFIREKRYLPVCETMRTGFPLPVKSVLSKTGSDKKRTVYTYPAPENTVLKLLTWLLLRRYDGLFSDGLFSFRPGRTAKDAVRRLLRRREISAMYGYKADIHDYFNSVPVDKLLPMLREAFSEDEPLYDFSASLLTESSVVDRGKIVREKKGIMAGTPLSAFCANLFLSGLDRYFGERGIFYLRYSDDILLFADTEEEREACISTVRSFLAERQLNINPEKEQRIEPGMPFAFLGFWFDGRKVDVAPLSTVKMKQKMRRKRNALARWKKRNGIGGEKAARAFIRVFNRKLFDVSGDNELSWTKWYYPVINTTESLHEIDLYAQDCIRYLISGTHTKKRFGVRYETLKEMGYRCLVHEYYDSRPEAIPREGS
jgi:hypothetical protein